MANDKARSRSPEPVEAPPAKRPRKSQSPGSINSETTGGASSAAVAGPSSDRDDEQARARKEKRKCYKRLDDHHYVCNVAGCANSEKQYATPQQVTMHVRISHHDYVWPWPCSSGSADCNKGYDNQGSLWHHMRTHHAAESRSKKQQYKCTTTDCGKVYTQKHYLERHMMLMGHGEHEPSSAVDDSDMVYPDNPLKTLTNGCFACNIPGCRLKDSSYLSIYSATEHVRKAHPSYPWPLACNVPGCTAGFMGEVALRFHVSLMHPGEKGSIYPPQLWLPSAESAAAAEAVAFFRNIDPALLTESHCPAPNPHEALEPHQAPVSPRDQLIAMYDWSANMRDVRTGRIFSRPDAALDIMRLLPRAKLVSLRPDLTNDYDKLIAELTKREVAHQYELLAAEIHSGIISSDMWPKCISQENPGPPYRELDRNISSSTHSKSWGGWELLEGTSGDDTSAEKAEEADRMGNAYLDTAAGDYADQEDGADDGDAVDHETRSSTVSHKSLEWRRGEPASQFFIRKHGSMESGRAEEAKRSSYQELDHIGHLRTQFEDIPTRFKTHGPHILESLCRHYHDIVDCWELQPASPWTTRQLYNAFVLAFRELRQDAGRHFPSWFPDFIDHGFKIVLWGLGFDIPGPCIKVAIAHCDYYRGRVKALTSESDVDLESTRLWAIHYFERTIIGIILQGWILHHVSILGVPRQDLELQAVFWMGLFSISRLCHYECRRALRVPARGVKKMDRKERVSTHTRLPRVLPEVPRCDALNMATNCLKYSEDGEYRATPLVFPCPSRLALFGDHPVVIQLYISIAAAVHEEEKYARGKESTDLIF